MPDKQITTLPSNLELEGGIVLGGDLSRADEFLQLDSAKLLRAPGDSNQVRVKSGMPATLSNPACSDSLAVQIASIKGRCINLTVSEPDSEAAAAWMNLLQQGGEPVPSPGPAGTGISMADLRDFSLRELDRAIRAFLDDLIDFLFDAATSTGGVSSSKDQYRQALDTVKQGREDICREFLGRIREHFDDMTPASHSGYQSLPDDADGLNLVDLREFEDHLALKRMIRIGEDLHQVALESLIFRSAELIGAEPLKLRLPVHVAELCTAFRRVIEDKKIPAEVLPAIFDRFLKRFITGLDPYYGKLNEALSSRGICPDIEQEIRARGSLLQRDGLQRKPPGKKPAAPAPGEKTAPPPAPAPAPAPAPGGDTAPPALDKNFQSVLNALNTRRQTEGTATASGPVVDTRKVAQTLDTLQHDTSAREALHAGTSLREYLSSGDLAGSVLSPESLNQLDLVDNLFGILDRQLEAKTELGSVLGELHIPLAKLAMLEPNFFGHREHPARGVVDRLAELSRVAQLPNPALESRVEGIISSIVENYQQDSGVFDEALQQIDKLARQQERAAQRNRERVISAEEGKARLQRARQAVDANLAELLGSARPPAVLRDLVDNGLRELLVLVLMKQGRDSTAWQENMQSLGTLAGLLQRSSGVVDQQQRQQLLAEAEPLLQDLGHRIADTLPTHVTHEAALRGLREVLAGERELETAEEPETPPPDTEDQRARIEDLPRLRRWVKRVEELETGCWLSYRDKSDRPRRMQLAWMSPARDRFIFVNERGQKHADLSAVQLARQLSRGVQPPVPAEELKSVDQSLLATLEQAQQTLSFDRNHDSLTRLINRETLLDQMNRALRHARRRASSHVVLCLDIDQFALVNQVYGRDNGDQVLAEFGKLLAQLHGKKSSSARLEADEFALLLLDRSVEEGMTLAEKIRADIAAGSAEINGEKVSFTASIGVAPLAEQSESVEAVLAQARDAMQQAKLAGRNRVCEFSGSHESAEGFRQQKARSRENLESALLTDRFLLRAQPIVQTSSDGSQKNGQQFELLLGIRNPDGSLSSPTEFITSAERYGLMDLVDRWVVKEAFSWISGLMDDQKVVPQLAVNLSGASISDDAFLDYLLEQISEFGVGTSRLCFEITETSSISNSIKAADFIRTFRNIGCKFSLDDFGTGLTSHNYLRELPVDFVKIDGSFVTEMHRNRADFAMVQSINDLAHFLGQQTIAESVENDEAMQALREIGVDYLQGWGIGRPRPLADISSELANLEH